jgi:hypothetical protein
MSVNRVCLIGRIAARPWPADGGALVLVTTVRPARTGEVVVDRHLVQASAEATAGLSTGALVLVEGALTRDQRRRRHVVLARRIVGLVEAAPPVITQSPPTDTHASPMPHERVGHFRRVGLGTPRERLVWVRETTVGARHEASDRR